MSNSKDILSHEHQKKKSLQYLIEADKFFTSIIYKIEKVPLLGPLLFKLWRKLRSFARSIYIFFTKFQFPFKKPSKQINEDSLNTLIYVSPNDIVYVTQDGLLIKKEKGSILSGNWDCLVKRFDDLNVFIAFKEVLIGQKNWEDTSYYQEITTKLNSGEMLWGCNNEKEFKDLCNKYSDLAQKFNTSHESTKRDFFLQEIGEEIIINIGRNGDLLLYKGEHAFAFAKVNGIEIIPVKIAFRHPDWMRFRKRYEKLAVGRGSEAYQPSLHPDLSHISAQQGSVERLEMINRNLSINEGRLLDLGANLGYFCIHFENQGFECVAVENSPRFAYCLEGLKRSLNKNFTIITDSLLDSKEIIQEPFDVVLALNIFHHLLKRKETFQKLVLFLEHLECSEMYFEPHLFEDPQMSHSYINMHEEEFAEFVRQKLKLNQSEIIGRASDNRPVYKIS
ncbi:MAG: class I SAM-dependent methyltransferase [Candidatus Helarchaeota archaeon]